MSRKAKIQVPSGGFTRLGHRAEERRLRVISTLFFFALTIPLGILIDKIYSQLENEALFQLRNESERVVDQVNRQITRALETEENRPFNDYSFFNVTEVPLWQQKRLAISPLAKDDLSSSPPGLVGYFQVDPAGGFSSPVVPSTELSEEDIKSLGLSLDEVRKRTEVRDQLYSMLFAGEPVPRQETPSPQKAAQQVASAVDNRLENSAASTSAATASETNSAESSLSKKNAELMDRIFRTSQHRSSVAKEKQQLTKKELASQIEQAQPEQFLNSQVGTFQGQKIADLNLEPKLAVKFKSQATISKIDKYLGDASSRKRVVVDTAAPENTTRDLYANYGSVTQQVAGNSGGIATSRPFNKETTESARASDSIGLKSNREGRVIESDISTSQNQPAQDNQQRAEIEAKKDRSNPGPSRQVSASSGVKILSFEAEIEPFRSRALPDRRIVFFRNVWRENRRYIQGFVVDGPAFLRQLISSPVADSALSGTAQAIVTYADEVFETISTVETSAAGQKREFLISSDKLSPPLNNFGLLWTASTLPEPTGRGLVDLLSFGLLGIVLVGQWALYTTARKQIRLARERSDFVSAVSHELKTPLTSIRMYAEMLREGWVSDESKKHSYYSFIFSESERLSRLINNVLDFSRLSNSHAPKLELKSHDPSDLYRRAHERIAAMVSSAGFTLEDSIDLGITNPEDGPTVMADDDAFIRIIINLVDNAIKFSAQAADKRIIFGIRRRSSGAPEVIFYVRDFGPGVPREKMKKIFTLFYRGTDEMTRTTQGTGIGLALVKELATKMNARIELSNQEPGALFEVAFRAQ
jgi:signal transduction histidine kinase